MAPEKMNKPVQSKGPVFGSLSIILPTVGAGLWMVFARNPQLGESLNGYAGMFILLALMFASGGLVLAGIGCGIVGLVRRERWRFLAVIGLLLNLAIVLFFRR
jgi:hypothetical protein